MAASCTCLQVLTPSNLIDAVHNEPILWNSYLEALTEEEKELASPHFVSDFCQAKCDFTRKTAVLRFGAPFGGLGQRTMIIL